MIKGTKVSQHVDNETFVLGPQSEHRSIEREHDSVRGRTVRLCLFLDLSPTSSPKLPPNRTNFDCLGISPLIGNCGASGKDSNALDQYDSASVVSSARNAST